MSTSLINFNFYNVVIFAGILHGLIFTGVIFLHPKYTATENKFLAYTVLALTGCNVQYWLKDVGLVSFDTLHIPTEFLILPFFYFFTGHYISQQLSRLVKVLLLLPFFIGLLLRVLIQLQIIPSSFILFISQELSALFFSLALIIVIFFMLRGYHKKANFSNRQEVIQTTNWINRILGLGFLICLFWLFETYFLEIRVSALGLNYYPLWLGVSFLIYWIALVGVFKTEVASNRLQIRRDTLKEDSENKKQHHYKRSNHYDRIRTFIVAEKNYLNPQMDLELLASSMKISKGYLSKIINENAGMNFKDYLNQLRVQESKKTLLDPLYSYYTITSIALECGFYSKSSFYAAFKKFTKMTPTAFRNKKMS
jgi:AraC-like DNA-binding protein